MDSLFFVRRTALDISRRFFSTRKSRESPAKSAVARATKNKCIATKDFSQLPGAAADGVFMKRKAAAKSSNQMGRIHQPSTTEQTENDMKTKSHSKTNRHEVTESSQEEMTMKNKSEVNSTVLTAITNPPSAALVYTAPVPGRTVLAETPGRLVKFLHVAGNDLSVNKALRAIGYSNAVHENGWTRVREAGAAREGGDAEPTDGIKAMSYLEGWCVPNFRRSQAVLTYDYPEQGAYVFENLRATRGPEAVVSAATYLARLNDLQSSPDRKPTRKVDHEALEGLAAIGITEDERKRVGAIVEIAETARNDGSTPTLDAQTQALLAAHSFFAKWSELARTVITNRSVLISMGIGKRRTRSAASTAPPATVVTPVSTPVTAPVATPPVVVAPAMPAAPPAPVLPAATPVAATAPAAPQLPAAGQTASTDSYKEHAAE